jgi:ADP-ribose pyrophosphatase YjhB (NUDIX family)
MEPQWLKWAKELQAIAQNGLLYASDKPYDAARYKRIREIASEMMAASGAADEEFFAELFGGEEGYATPKVDVRGAIFRDDKILLVKEISDGGWTLPGGWADVNDSPREAVEREVWEESGYEVRATRLLAVYDRSKHGHVPAVPFYVYKIFILCELLGGKARASIETSDVGFFAEDDLPPLSVARVTAKQIARLFELQRHPDWPADLD